MCTVTYLPLNDGGFIVTSNRDEHVLRPAALLPQSYRVHDHDLLFPKDPQGSGTWLACSPSTGHVLCLLNGAAEAHHHKPPYRKSRGLIVLDFFESADAAHFASAYDFSGIEPFTLIIAHSVSGFRTVKQLRWDEKEISLVDFHAETPAIWSSSTLYSPEIRRLREEWFAAWLKENQDYSSESISGFHHFAGDGNPSHSLVMQRQEKLKTVSISSATASPSGMTLHYHDLLNDSRHTFSSPDLIR